MRLVTVAVLEVRGKTVCGPDLSGVLQSNTPPGWCNLATFLLLQEASGPVRFCVFSHLLKELDTCYICNVQKQ